MRSLLIFIMVISTIPTIFISAHIGIYIWAWISYMNPHRLTFGFTYTFPFLDMIAAASLIALFIGRDTVKIPKHPLFWLIILYAFWTVFTTLFAGDWERTSPPFIEFMKIILFTVLAGALINTEKRLVTFLTIIALAIGFYLLKGGIFTVLTGGGFRIYGPAGSFIADNNHIGLAFNMMLPIFWFLSRHSSNKLLRWLFLACFLVGPAAIIGTHSRGSAVAFLAMAGFWLLRSNRKMLVVPLILIGAVVATPFVASNWTQRMETIQNYDEDKSFQGRVGQWRFATNVANANPVFGGGFDVFFDQDYRDRYGDPSVKSQNAHSNYFAVLAEQGYVGLFFFMLILTTSMVTCERIFKQFKNEPSSKGAKELARALQLSMIGYGVNGLSLNLDTFDLFYHLAIATAVLATIAREYQSQSAPQPAPTYGQRQQASLGLGDAPATRSSI